METMRLILIFLHTLIIIFAAVDLHYHFAIFNKAANHQQQISAILRYVTDLFYISLYHTASIVAVWFSRLYGAGMIRASGILLIGELLQSITSIIQLTITAHRIDSGENLFFGIFYFLLLIALLITFRLAEKVSKYEKNLMQVELLADTVHDIPMDDRIEPTVYLK